GQAGGAELRGADADLAGAGPVHRGQAALPVGLRDDLRAAAAAVHGGDRADVGVAARPELRRAQRAGQVLAPGLPPAELAGQPEPDPVRGGRDHRLAVHPVPHAAVRGGPPADPGRAVRGGHTGRGQPAAHVLADHAAAAALHHRHVGDLDDRRVADLLRHHLHHDRRGAGLHDARAVPGHVQRGVPPGPVRLRQRAGGRPGPLHRLRVHGQPAGRSRVSFRAGRVIAFVLATLWLVVVIAPLYYMILASFRTQGTYLTANPWVPSGGLSASSYSTVFHAGLGRYLVNSVVLTAACI